MGHLMDKIGSMLVVKFNVRHTFSEERTRGTRILVVIRIHHVTCKS